MIMSSLKCMAAILCEFLETYIYFVCFCFAGKVQQTAQYYPRDPFDGVAGRGASVHEALCRQCTHANTAHGDVARQAEIRGNDEEQAGSGSDREEEGANLCSLHVFQRVALHLEKIWDKSDAECDVTTTRKAATKNNNNKSNTTTTINNNNYYYYCCYYYGTPVLGGGRGIQEDRPEVEFLIYLFIIATQQQQQM